jgi:leucyl aminopeptidase (aminopeptidase T)
MSSQMMAMIRGARILTEDSIGIKAGENVLIITDTNKLEIAEIISLVAHELGAEVVTVIMTPRTRHAEEPPPMVAASMLNADAVIMPTTYSLTHTSARKAATEKGVRVLTLPGILFENFTSGVMNVDLLSLKPQIDKVTKRLANAKEARITTPLGTDLYLELNSTTYVEDGLCRKPGELDAFPGMETAAGIKEFTANGVFIVDGVAVPGDISGTHRMITEPICLTFEQGAIIKIEGGEDANALRELLAYYKDNNVYQAVELGLGMNPYAKAGRGLIEDEAEYGTLHVAVGEGRSFGSSIRAPAHIDFVIRHPTLALDREILMREGELVS